MLLPNAYSFSLKNVRRAAPRPSSTTTSSVAKAIFHEQATDSTLKGLKKTAENNNRMFLPNTESFILVRKAPTTKSDDPLFLPNESSFLLVWSKTQSNNPPQNATYVVDGTKNSGQPSDPEQISVDDQKKRTFLKAAGVAGAGLVASQLLPKDASALILGSSPTTGIVGVKNAANARINPATEETVDGIVKTTDLDFDGSGYLNVNVAAGGVSSFSDSGDVSKLALVDVDRHVQVDVLSSALPTSASTESTLQTISFGGVKYALRMVTSGVYDYIGEASIGSATSSAVWRVKRVDNTSGDVTITWAGTGTFNQIWDNYASLTYT